MHAGIWCQLTSSSSHSPILPNLLASEPSQGIRKHRSHLHSVDRPALPRTWKCLHQGKPARTSSRSPALEALQNQKLLLWIDAARPLVGWCCHRRVKPGIHAARQAVGVACNRLMTCTQPRPSLPCTNKRTSCNRTFAVLQLPTGPVLNPACRVTRSPCSLLIPWQQAHLRCKDARPVVLALHRWLKAHPRSVQHGRCFKGERVSGTLAMQ